jgi:hypothetical protein
MVAATGFILMIASRQDDRHHDGVIGDPTSNPRSSACTPDRQLEGRA